MSEATNTVTVGATRPGRPAHSDRPRRFEDATRNEAYWARIDAIVDQAPPLSDEQRAIIRTAFHQPEARRAAA